MVTEQPQIPQLIPSYSKVVTEPLHHHNHYNHGGDDRTTTTTTPQSTVVVVVVVVWWFCKHFTMITIIKPKAPFPVMNEIIPPYLDCGGCGGVVRPTAPFPVLKELIQPYLDCGGCGGVVVLPTIS